MPGVEVREENIIIDTYEIAEYDKNPMFLEKRVYQGSCGKVYPHPVCEGVADVKTEREYKAIILENEYIYVMILPELGGRIQRLLDKTNGYDAVYYNKVIKPALVGLAGPWISGGIEFNWPQHHRPSTFDPVDYSIEKRENGSVTVWVGETEKMFHTKGMAGFTVYPDKAYLEIKGQIYNPTDRPQTFLWWANPAVSVNENTQSVFPPDVTAVMDHGKRDVSKFPIADGVYYKVNYAPGTDISRYKNIPVPTSYMAHHSDYDFIGNYDHGKKAGLLHIADHHVSPGKKQWTWGNGDFGQAWDRNLTDENGPYIELMTGMFTDNQPDFTYLKPYEEKSFTQYFMPYKDAGAVKNASLDIFLNLECIKKEQGMEIQIAAYAPCEQENICIELVYDGEVKMTDMTEISPVKTYQRILSTPVLDENKLLLRASKNGKVLLQYMPEGRNEENIPEPATELPAPENVESNERLFLAATHLEQYRHATYSPEDYYLEGLKRDDTDLRLNNGYGKYLYQRGFFEEARKHFEKAIETATWKNPNPYDCEPYYNLGLALLKLNMQDKAYDAFYKATWDGNMQNNAFYQLACIATGRQEYELALSFVEQSLQRGTHHIKARALRTSLLRLVGRKQDAMSFVKETMQIDALDHGAQYEWMKLGQMTEAEFVACMRDDEHNYIELALTYMESGLDDQAIEILSLIHDTGNDIRMTPLSGYYLYYLTKEEKYLRIAEQTKSDYCFPNRLEDMVVLQYAVEHGGQYAAYYLGNLLYDRQRFEDAKILWEGCAAQLSIPTAYRNLSFIYFNKLHDEKRAREVLEKAFAMDIKDARVFFELDQLYKSENETVEIRLANMREHQELLEKRDDLYTEFITLLNMNQEYEEAYERIMGHIFHPWEGGEGKIPAQYRISLMQIAKKVAAKDEKAKSFAVATVGIDEKITDDKEAASEVLRKALSYPHNLGEGKLIGNLDNDLYYMLSQLTEDKICKEKYLQLAARGDGNLSSAMYYNDQPPQMMFYATKAKEILSGEEKKDLFDAFIQYGKQHMNDVIKIDYFAVSLPDFLVFDADLNKNNMVHCYYMMALGYLGKGDVANAKVQIEKGLALKKCHQELLLLKQESEQ